MRNHAVTAAQGVVHGTPRVVLRRWLNVPHIPSVAGDLTTLQGSRNRVLVTDSTARGVDEPSTLLEVLEELSVDETASTLMERAVDGDDVALYVIC